MGGGEEVWIRDLLWGASLKVHSGTIKPKYRTARASSMQDVGALGEILKNATCQWELKQGPDLGLELCLRGRVDS